MCEPCAHASTILHAWLRAWTLDRPAGARAVCAQVEMSHALATMTHCDHTAQLLMVALLLPGVVLRG